MVNFNQTWKNVRTLALALSILNAFLLFNNSIQVEARDKGGDDIILTKGKLIMRGGKGKGNLILDTGKSHEGHEMSHHMMPHFNPYSFYPIQHQEHHQAPQMVIRPVFIEDHSAMHHQSEHHQHHEEPHHYQHHEYHHQEPHHEMHHEPHHEMHHEPHHEMHHEPHHEMHHEPHHEMHHEMHHEPHHYEHHEPQHYEHESHHEGEEEHHGGYETHPMMQMMMAHGSGLQPSYQQLVAMQALQQPVMYAQHLQAFNNQPQSQLSTSSSQQKQQQQTAQPAQQQSKHSSFINNAANNPLAAIIKPLFKRNNPTKQKKP